MHKEDIAQVTDIDRKAFPTLWPPVNYRHELQNPLAHYIVTCAEEKMPEEPRIKVVPQKGFARLKSRVGQWLNFSSREASSSGQQYIFGFAGFWIMADEAHIINLAVRETHRQQGIGEALLIATMDLAAQLKARLLTLEVRASNTAALNLYGKYGFTQVGLRRGYYMDNKEDAIVMSTEETTSAPFQARLQHLKHSHSQKWGIPQYQIVP